jgi:hypothetical protein
MNNLKNYSYSIIFIAVLIIAYFSYIHKFGINVPQTDQFEYLRFIIQYYKGESGLYDYIVKGHNEHLVGLSFFLMTLLDWGLNFNFKLNMYFSGILQIISSLLLVITLRQSINSQVSKNFSITTLFILMFSFAPVQNIFYSFNFIWFASTFFICCSFFCCSLILQNNNLNKNFLIVFSLILSFLSVLCSAQGLLAFISIGIFVFCLQHKNGISNYFSSSITKFWFVGSLFLTVLFLIIIKNATILTISGEKILFYKVISAIPLVLSTPLGNSNLYIAYFYGISIIFIIGMILINLFKEKKLSYFAIPVTFIAFGVLYSIAVSIGRAPLGTIASREDRYAAYVVFVLIGIIFIIFSNNFKSVYIKSYRLYLIFLLLITFIFSIKHSLTYGIYVREERSIASMLFYDINRATDFQIRSMLYADPKIVRESSAFFKSHSLWRFGEDSTTLPIHARPYAKVPKQLLALVNRNQDLYQEPINKLWSAYIACGDLRRYFVHDSNEFPPFFMQWVVNALNDGSHTIVPEIIKYKSVYEIMLKDILKRPLTMTEINNAN